MSSDLYQMPRRLRMSGVDFHGVDRTVLLDNTEEIFVFEDNSL
jgi:hypothetical protein